MYDAYKPLRNRLRKANLVRGLQAVWHVYAYQSSKVPIPAWLTPQGFRHGQRLDIQHWQLLLLVRELILNASMDSSEQFTWTALAGALNDLSAVQQAISQTRYDDATGPDTAWWDVHAVAHQQFPLQRKQTIQRLLRYEAIFGTEALNKHLENKVGLAFDECILLSFMMVGAFEREGRMRKDQVYDEFGITKEKLERFYELVSASPDKLRTELLETQRFDENWAFTFNALEGHPLITFGNGSAATVICPIPALIWNRLSTSIFFDLFKERGFNNDYGDAFESYVGEFSKSALPAPAFSIAGDSIYKVGKFAKLGLDWVITDHQANLLVECKTKRVKADAKTLDVGAILNELDKLADAVVQSYKNALDLRAGNTNIAHNGKKCYLAVVTLEDWYLISFKTTEELRARVLTKLTNKGIDTGIADEIPFAVMSCDEFEKMVFAIREHGIDHVLGGKSIGDNNYVPMDAFLRKYTEEIRASYNETYRPLWNGLIGRITAQWPLEYRDKLNADFSPL